MHNAQLRCRVLSAKPIRRKFCFAKHFPDGDYCKFRFAKLGCEAQADEPHTGHGLRRTPPPPTCGRRRRGFTLANSFFPYIYYNRNHCPLSTVKNRQIEKLTAGHIVHSYKNVTDGHFCVDFFQTWCYTGNIKKMTGGHFI